MFCLTILHDSVSVCCIPRLFFFRTVVGCFGSFCFAFFGMLRFGVRFIVCTLCVFGMSCEGFLFSGLRAAFPRDVGLTI